MTLTGTEGRASDPGREMARRLAAAEAAGRVPGLHVLLVGRAGRTLLEHYGHGPDESWGTPLGEVVFGPRVLHDLRSVSKTVVGLLYGIALAEGKVPPPEAGLYAQFPRHADLAAEPGRARLTVAHVLGMTLGLAWDELTWPYSDARNSEIRMERAADRYRYVLSLPIESPPGERWTYCGGATALLGHLIARGTGERLTDYARRVLFEPLGFGATGWSIDPSGEPRAASGARLLPPDLLRLGTMVLNDGVWQGRRLVPAEWLQASTTPRVRIDAGRQYGWHWYLSDLPLAGGPRRMLSAVGWGGQRLYLVPALDLAVVIHCGNYGRPGVEQSRIATTLLDEVVLPVVT